MSRTRSEFALGRHRAPVAKTAVMRERNSTRLLACGTLLAVIAAASPALPQESPASPASPQPAQPAPARSETAPRLVREANRLLLGRKPVEALNEYQKAESLRPDAREIAFGEGLANYALGQYDKARDAFHRAAGGAADSLADDALYSLGTCDHAEAFAAQDPKVALGKLENAMRSYQSVLANRPDHSTARDANLKAASYWRQLKQQLKQQQQQQQQQNPDQKKDQQQDNQQQQQQQQEQEQKREEQSEQQQSKEAEEQNQQQDQQQQQSSNKDEQKKDEKAEQQQTERENVSREQAERKLREMMQTLRERKKLRREEVKSPPYRPTEKDW